MFELSNKKILVTGASSGIGRSVSLLLSNMGASVVITGRNKERLNDTYCCLTCNEGQHHYQYIADLDNDDQIEWLASESLTLDGIVCCSGINDKAPIKHVSREKIEKMYATNVYGPMLLIKELLKKKKVNSSASTINPSGVMKR